MLLDPIILSLCSTIAINGGGGNPQAPTACHQALSAASAQTQTTATITLLESYSRNLVESNISKKVLYPTIAIGAIVNSWNQKQITAQFPLKPVFDEVNFNLTSTRVSVTIKWEWKF